VSRLFPQPAMSASLFVVWLLLHNSAAPGVVVLGVILAVAVPLVTDRFWPEYPRTIRLGRLLRFVPIVLLDIIIANLRVAALIIGPARRWRPHFIVIPLDLRHPFAITLLASIITLTPGTVSANLSGDRRSLLVHGLAVPDPDEAVRGIKQRYEKPLREIFE
jgi:multicomponent K+:H+ antiporter subunit E